jgi:hypothetical protein
MLQAQALSVQAAGGWSSQGCLPQQGTGTGTLLAMKHMCFQLHAVQRLAGSG